MSEIVCLYCKTQSEEKEGICTVCGMPLSLSNPSIAVSTPRNHPVGGTPKEKDLREKRLPKRIYIALSICGLISFVGFLVQRHFSIEESRPENSRVILDQSVGVPKASSPGAPEQVNPDYEAAKRAFNAGRLDEAEQRLKKIPQDDKDYSKVRRLMLDIESERRLIEGGKENHKDTKTQRF
jgi:hypothetical protein